MLPADDDEAEDDNNTSEKQPADNEYEVDTNDETTNSSGFSVSEGETENGILILEGMEDEGIFTNFTLEPYGIHYQIEEFLGNYQVEDESVTYYSDADNARVRLKAEENAALNEVFP